MADIDDDHVKGSEVDQVHHTLSDPTFGNDMLSVLNDMRAEGVLLDVTVVVGEEEFMAHSTILAYGSDFFRRLFASGMKETKDNRVELKDPCISMEGFRILLDFLYTGKLLVSSADVYDVLLVANHLQVQPVLTLCYEFISQNMHNAPLDLVNYTKAQEVADTYGLKTLQEKVDSALAENFLELSTSEDFLTSTRADQLVKLLQLNNIVSPSELQVYEAVVRWIMYDEHTRMPRAAEVLSHVRFALLDQNTLSGLLQTDMGAIECCRQLILEAMAYHSYPPEMKQGIDWPRAKPRTKPEKKVLLAFCEQTFNKELKTTWIFTANGWKKQTDVHAPGCIGAATVVGNILYVMLEFMSSFQSYDPIENIWNNLPSPPDSPYQPRIPQMTSVDAKLFLVAGKDSKKSRVCRYDICGGRWTHLPTLSRYSAEVTLASCQGVVFAIGGDVKVSDEKQTCIPTSVVETFFPPNNSWKAVTPTTHPHSGATAMVQGDIIYIAGGRTFIDGETRSSTIVEMCRTGLHVTMTGSPWSVVPQPLSVHEFSSQVAVIDRKAYFILGGQMHFTGKFVDNHTLEEDVEDMCYSFKKDIPSHSIKVCATLAILRTNED